MRIERPPRWLHLGDDELFVQSSGANRTSGRTAAGGWLALTSHRLIHHTHLFERGTSGIGDWQAVLTGVVDVGLVDPGGIDQMFTGGLRQRLRVTTADDNDTLFVVNAIGQWQAAIRKAMGR